MRYKYNVVSMGAMLRDYDDVEYIDDEHKRLCDIADTLYNANIPVSEWRDNPEYDYKGLYAKYGEDYWRLVLKDMSALDTQLYGSHIDELKLDYGDFLSGACNAKEEGE